MGGDTSCVQFWICEYSIIVVFLSQFSRLIKLVVIRVLKKKKKKKLGGDML